jgi:hypothetical protein
MNSRSITKLAFHAARRVLQLAKWLLALWLFGLIAFAGPFSSGFFNLTLALLWLAALVWLSLRISEIRKRFRADLILLVLPLIPHFFRQPSHDREWDIPYQRTAWAEVSGDTVNIHHFRCFDYAANGTTIPSWRMQSYDLKNLRGMDFIMSHWGSEWVGHPIFSFDFGSEGHLAFTIEARMEKGESYALFPGLYRQYELAYIPCAESDAVRVRTNVRKGEDVRLYRTIATPEQARDRLIEFLASMNQLRKKPRFYNILTSNCTTAVRSQMTSRLPMDWRIILNGKLDAMLYERGILVSKGLSFQELSRRAIINSKARAHPSIEGFSEKIREGVPGFEY